MENLTALQEAIIEKSKANIYEEAEKTNKGKKWLANRINKEEARQLAIMACNTITDITIGVEWRRSTTWGSIPTATVKVWSKDDNGNSKYEGEFTAKASGCGYDKLSACIASALNQCDAFKRLLYVTYETKGKEGKPYGVYFSEYGAHLEGGVGVNCYTRAFEWLGYDFKSTAWGKTFNAYTVDRLK